MGSKCSKRLRCQSFWADFATLYLTIAVAYNQKFVDLKCSEQDLLDLEISNQKCVDLRISILAKVEVPGCNPPIIQAVHAL